MQLEHFKFSCWVSREQFLSHGQGQKNDKSWEYWEFENKKIFKKLSTAKFYFLKIVTGILAFHGRFFLTISQVGKKVSREKNRLC